jgi:TonB family protein
MITAVILPQFNLPGTLRLEVMLRRTAVALVLLLLVTFSSVAHCFSQQDDPQNKRQIVNKVTPQYPALARTMSLRGTVKVEALVSSEGKVTRVNVKGGHPVLAQAALNAVREWKWEPAGHESTEPIEVKFDP